jgi:cytochrome c-type biogenesis protein CcmH
MKKLSVKHIVMISLLSVALAGLASAQDVELNREVFEIARELRCPTCRAEGVAESSAPISIEMRNIIAEQLEQGKSRAEILAFFQARYGDWILLEPPRRGLHLIVWIMPIAIGLLSLGILVFFFRRWHKNANAPIEADAADLERVRMEIRRNANMNASINTNIESGQP